jgi:hypothetical protein
MRGRFVWYDLMTNDTDGAVDFYGNVIGWGTVPFEGGDMPYTMWTAGETPIGGVAAIDPTTMGDIPPNWMAHITTPDVDAAADRIKELGGAIHNEPMDIPNVGRFAVASDPQGAAFAIFTPTEEPSGQDEAARPGEFSWRELTTTDYRAAFDFYSDLFGWEITNDSDMGEMGIYRIFGLNGRDLGGMYDKTDQMPGPPFWLYYVSVKDLDKAAEAVKQHGGRVLNGPMEVPGGDRIAQCMDPQGAAFAIHGK